MGVAVSSLVIAPAMGEKEQERPKLDNFASELWYDHEFIVDGTILDIRGFDKPERTYDIQINSFFKPEEGTNTKLITVKGSPNFYNIQGDRGIFFIKKVDSQWEFGDYAAKITSECLPELMYHNPPLIDPPLVRGPPPMDFGMMVDCYPNYYKKYLPQYMKARGATEFPSPRTQSIDGVPPHEIVCNKTLNLIQKHDDSPACVNPETKEKLEQRGWTITVHTSEDFAKQSTAHEGKNNISKMHALYSVKKPLDSFETDSFHFMHYEDWDYDFLWKAARYGATYLTDDEKDHYENTLKQNGTNFKMTNHKGPSYYEMKLVEEHLPVESDLIKFTEYPSYIIEKYGDDMLSHNLGSTGFDKESEDLWIDAMQKPYEWTEVTERGGAFAYNRIGSGFPYFQMSDGTWVQMYYLGPRMDNHGLFELYAQGYGSEHPLEEFPEQTGDYPPGSKVLVRDREGSVSLTISVSDWEEYEQFRTGDNSKDYPPPVKVTDGNMHFVYFDMLLELNTPEGFAETPGRPDEYRKNIDKDYPIHSHREIYDWLRLESGKQYGYSAGGDISPFFEYRDRLYRISSAIID